ncbi:hydroxymethylbilane synthase [Thermosediminibacter oceani DSM 16646]|uniref:Porphobilinogen deaminase n=1 Tax=Thermosediminibacter oceani (strain ATCC BAA-1034 / DSM 16646 / JW/IW-1228P) TaxID=555079 RepID=D9S0T7_THEOJ|nr:hydroxymethylbilane synthase [Thermosediminibacter oceani]ADL07101.1 hydroxymethylbilane synthase [Thermosediminibacter oceani DSM 16646]
MIPTGRIVRVGSRESRLALVQTEIVIRLLKDRRPELEFEVVKIKTQGDKLLDVNLSDAGGKGVFVKEIEEALLAGSIDLAVHSMKDVPYELPEGLCIAAVTEREDPRDVLISRDKRRLLNLRPGARIGTSSLRRSVQLKALRPDLDIVPVRGNVPTRIRKMDDLELDGLVLAAAGIKRLGLEELIAEYFPPEVIVPAVGQGALAVEARKDDDILELAGLVSHKATEVAVRAERSFMRALGGSCRVPLGAFARVEGTVVTLVGMVEKNGSVCKGTMSGKLKEAEEIGLRLAERLGDSSDR